jgi:hypothetical protein
VYHTTDSPNLWLDRSLFVNELQRNYFPLFAAIVGVCLLSSCRSVGDSGWPATFCLRSLQTIAHQKEENVLEFPDQADCETLFQSMQAMIDHLMLRQV